MNGPPLSEDFRRKVQDITESVRSIDFSILLWGPGEDAEEDYEKRLRIRKYLSETFGEQNILMSEDDAFIEQVEEFGLVIAEAIQAGSVDAVIVLITPTSIGAHTEIVRYESIIARKALVFVPHEYKESKSLAATAYYALQTEGYTQEEFESCNKISQRAWDFAQALRWKKCNLGELGSIFGS